MCALQKSLVPVAMSGGLETKTDPAQLQMGSLLTLQNGLFTNPGRIIKRTGSQAFGKNIQNSSSNSSIQAAQALQMLIGFGEPLVGRMLLWNAKSTNIDEIRIARNPECSVCGKGH